MKRHLHHLGAAVVSGALLASLLTACGGGTTAETPSVVPESPAQQTEQAATETRTVTDAAGNVVEVPAELSRIAVTPLPWSPVIYAIDGTSEHMVSINPGAMTAYTNCFFSKLDSGYAELDTTSIGSDSVIYAIDGTSEHMVSINPGAMTAYTNCFFSKLDSGYAELDTTSIGSDFSINMEEMVIQGVQAVVIWDYQTEEAEQLKALGITPVMVKNETIEDLQASFTAIGQMLGKEERAEQFNTLYTEAYEYLQSFQEQVNTTDRPKVLYLRNAKLKLQGNDMFIAEALELAGADNVAADLSSITMEEILTIDPDIILMSNFDSFTPADLYENRLDGQDWSQVSAVLNHRVYKTPMGIYRWDAPGVETPLMMRWLAQLIQPEIFSEIDIEQDTRAFFQNYFGYSLTDEDLAQIFAADANADSQ